MKSKTGNIVILKKRLLILPAAAIMAILLYKVFYIKLTGHHEGIFLLKGRKGHLFEVKDDLYLGDGSRYIFGLDFDRFMSCRKGDFAGKAPCLYYEWNEKDGSGFIRNYLPGGRQIFTSLSRFEYAEKESDIPEELEVHGIFVGGGLPANVAWENEVMENETGMAYFDGKRWFHLWCNVNEGIASAITKRQLDPSRWRFLGSRILNASNKELALTSEHEVGMDGVPLRIRKSAYFRAGRPYFIMSIKVTNAGDRPVGYYYTYGDEPWLGDFGTSAGNVGWVSDRLIKYVQFVDTSKYNYAGLFDYGNDANGSPHNFTNVANFIEWHGKNKPAVYFSNGADDYPKNDGKKVPLSSDERFIGLEWGPITLAPGESDMYALVIGMAEYNPITGLPVKPSVRLKFVPQ